MKPFLSILLVICLIGCKQAHNKTQPVIYITQAGDKIVFKEDYYRDFLDAVKVTHNKMDSLYKAKIFDLLIKPVDSSMEYSSEFAIKDTSGMENNIALIKNNHAKIEELITAALLDSRKYLQNDSVTFYITPSSNFDRKVTIKMNGVNGRTTTSKIISIELDLNLIKWSEVLKNAIAHEYNHSYAFKIHPPESTKWILLEDLILEGKADSYAHLLYPTVYCPWDSALSEDDKTTLWNRVKPDLDSISYPLYTKVMFGSDTSKLYPQWGGYTLGYSIVQSMLKNNPKLTPVEWMNLSSEQILEMSDYKDR